MCIVLCPVIVQITMYFFVTMPCHTSPSVRHHEVVVESLCKICHNQQNMPQHYFLLDTLVICIVVDVCKLLP